MNKTILVSLALGSVLAYIPTALADSFSYRTNGSNVTGNFALDFGHEGLAKGSAEAAVTTKGDINAYHGAAIASGTGADGLRQAGDVGFSIDDVQDRGNSANGVLEAGGALVDLSGNQPNLLFGSLNGSKRGGSQGDGQVLFADKAGTYTNNAIQRGNGNLVAGAATLTATPEPGSLFLLGTGLLCMALALFRKAGRRPTETLS
jgi:hypothetical protein